MPPPVALLVEGQRRHKELLAVLGGEHEGELLWQLELARDLYTTREAELQRKTRKNAGRKSGAANS